jgi:hypothetical protein
VTFKAEYGEVVEVVVTRIVINVMDLDLLARHMADTAGTVGGKHDLGGEIVRDRYTRLLRRHA